MSTEPEQNIPAIPPGTLEDNASKTKTNEEADPPFPADLQSPGVAHNAAAIAGGANQAASLGPTAITSAQAVGHPLPPQAVAPGAVALAAFGAITHGIEVYRRQREKEQRDAAYLVEKLASLPAKKGSSELIDLARAWENSDRPGHLKRKFNKFLKLIGIKTTLSQETNKIFDQLKEKLEEELNTIKNRREFTQIIQPYSHEAIAYKITLELTDIGGLTFKIKETSDQKEDPTQSEQKNTGEETRGTRQSASNQPADHVPTKLSFSANCILTLRKVLDFISDTSVGRAGITLFKASLWYVIVYSVFAFIDTLSNSFVSNLAPYALWWIPGAILCGAYLFFELYTFFSQKHAKESLNLTRWWECYVCSRMLFIQEYYKLYFKPELLIDESLPSPTVTPPSPDPDEAKNFTYTSILPPINRLQHPSRFSRVMRRIRTFFSGFMDGFLVTFICLVFAKFINVIGLISAEAASHGLVMIVLGVMGCVLGMILGIKRMADSEHQRVLASEEIEKASEELKDIERKEEVNQKLRKEIEALLKKPQDANILQGHTNLGLPPEKNWFKKQFFIGLKIKEEPVHMRGLKKFFFYGWIFFTQGQSGFSFIRLLVYTGGIWAGTMSGLSAVVLASSIGAFWALFKMWETHLHKEEENNLNFLYERGIRAYNLDYENRWLQAYLTHFQGLYPQSVGLSQTHKRPENQGELTIDPTSALSPTLKPPPASPAFEVVPTPSPPAAPELGYCNVAPSPKGPRKDDEQNTASRPSHDQTSSHQHSSGDTSSFISRLAPSITQIWNGPAAVPPPPNAPTAPLLSSSHQESDLSPR